MDVLNYTILNPTKLTRSSGIIVSVQGNSIIICFQPSTLYFEVFALANMDTILYGVNPNIFKLHVLKSLNMDIVVDSSTVKHIDVF